MTNSQKLETEARTLAADVERAQADLNIIEAQKPALALLARRGDADAADRLKGLEQVEQEARRELEMAEAALAELQRQIAAARKNEAAADRARRIADVGRRGEQAAATAQRIDDLVTALLDAVDTYRAEFGAFKSAAIDLSPDVEVAFAGDANVEADATLQRFGLQRYPALMRDMIRNEYPARLAADVKSRLALVLSTMNR